ncbi:MAG: hypothetical protein A2Z25_20345 [Planctomycetes bacterium RBG_16_55_9]|nr:MAG: hypothetical protein A2Z25_20345 [Planctomycetes bacterium RBG_16_55_9]
MGKTSEAHRCKVFMVIRLALLAVLGYAAVRTVSMVSGGDEAFIPNSISGAEGKSQVDTASLPPSSVRDHSAIFERDLFGKPASSPGPEMPPKTDNVAAPDRVAPKELAIAVLGTVAGSPEISRAIIKDLETNTLSLGKVGDTVGSASIESIEKDTVVLLHEGRRTMVHLGTTESKRREVNDVEPTLAGYTTRAIEHDPQEKPPTTLADKLKYSATMLPKAVIEPYAVDGKPEGLQITGIEQVKYLQELGLKNGDVIRTVNGHRLTSKQKAYQISRKARSQTTVSIGLLRGNKSKTFSFGLN